MTHLKRNAAAAAASGRAAPNPQPAWNHPPLQADNNNDLEQQPLAELTARVWAGKTSLVRIRIARIGQLSP